MPFKFFHIPIRDPGPAQAELNAFLASHKVLAVERRWVEQGPDSFWSFCIDYMAQHSPASNTSSPKGRSRGNRVNRGGSWNSTARNCRSSNRNRNEPTNRNNNLGFRLVAAPCGEWMPPLAEPTAFQSCEGLVFLAGKRSSGRPVLVARSHAPGGLYRSLSDVARYQRARHPDAGSCGLLRLPAPALDHL